MLSHALLGDKGRQEAAPMAKWPGLGRAGSGGWFCRAKWPDPASTALRGPALAWAAGLLP